jgi:hypothetical protein
VVRMAGDCPAAWSRGDDSSKPSRHAGVRPNDHHVCDEQSSSISQAALISRPAIAMHLPLWLPPLL